MRSLLLLGAATLWPAGAVAQSTLAQDATMFGARESISAADLSPDGSKIVYIQPTTNGEAAVLANVQSGKAAAFLQSDSAAERLQGCGFVTNDRLICRYSGTSNVNGMLVPYARLFAINSDGSAAKPLGQGSSFYDERLRQYDGDIVDWLPGERSVLMSRDYVPEVDRTSTRISRKKDGIGVDQIDTLSLTAKSVEPPRKGVSEYMSDGRGNVRLMIMDETDGSGRLTGRTRIDYRTAGSRDWKTLSGFGGEEIIPLAIDSGSDSLYALKSLQGRKALYRIGLTNPVTTALVVSHPKVDIDEVIRSGHGQGVIGYSFVDDKRQTIYFDPERKALAQSLSKAIPGLPLVRFVGSSQDGSKSLIFAGSDSDPGRYYLYDHRAKQLSELFLARPQLEKKALAAVKPVTVRVADGTMVPAYVTLPPGKAAKNLPAVVLPHGGPSSRDEWGFDWLAQFLAARGYAVIQPNYRGSAGFGDHWLVENGFKSWKTSIGDITGSIRWLVSEGIADPDRLAVVGWSYGGYAALQAAATEPGLFKAVAAIAPVTDLEMLKKESADYTNSYLVSDFIGSGPHIRDGSPLRLASSIKAPVLLAHGDLDLNVGVDQSLKMESALQSAGGKVEMLRFRTLDHHLENSAARQELLSKIGELLDRTIGK